MKSPPFLILAGLLLAAPACPRRALAVDTAASATAGDSLTEVTVTASRLDLLGTATTASQGSVTEQELYLRPAYRRSRHRYRQLRG
jgi:hypothetical protein